MTTSAVPELPEEVETTREFDGYYTINIPDRDILDALVESHNRLIRYLRSKQ